MDERREDQEGGEPERELMELPDLVSYTDFILEYKR